MKNKIKKFGALFMALMLLVSGFGNLGTVLAEDEDNKVEYGNYYKAPMVIDDPLTFDFAKYFAENYVPGPVHDDTILSANARVGDVNYAVNLVLVPNISDDKKLIQNGIFAMLKV